MPTEEAIAHLDELRSGIQMSEFDQRDAIVARFMENCRLHLKDENREIILTEKK